jgi:bromodomain-containing protein 7/9
MAGHLESFSSSYYQSESPKIRIPKPSGSGLTLVIPSLKNLKAQKSAKETPRAQTPIYHDVVQVPEKPKIQRPLKLKPLKEVLSKLIAQLKK